MSNNKLNDLLEKRLNEHHSGEPLYRCLTRGVQSAISEDLLSAGDYIPSERVLAESLGVSRVTVRKALNGLVQDGTLTRRQGARTHVSEKTRIEKRASNITGFTEGIAARGKVPGTRWIFKGIVPPEPKDIINLGISPDQFVLKLNRVRLADERPIAIEAAVVPAHRIGTAELKNDSLYATLDAKGLRPTAGYQRIFADAVGVKEAELLDCVAGSPVLVSQRKCMLRNGEIIEYAETRYRGDEFDFVTEIG